MLSVVLLGLLGCTSTTEEPPLTDTDTHRADTGDTGEDTGGAVDTGDADVGPCPEGMLPVPSDEPVFCIDQYEASADGEGAISASGLVPLTEETFDEARARCEATPVENGRGEVVGYRRLVTLQEWQDAADGVLGDGGSSYPTGEAWPEEQCVVLKEDGTAQYSEIQLTGSAPKCSSVFGVLDQLGNAWEWADPLLDLDLDAFFSTQADAGLVFAVKGETLLVKSGDPSRLILEVAGLQGSLAVVDGVVVASEVTFQAEEPFTYSGYLVDRERETLDNAGWALPVTVEREGGVVSAEAAPLVVRLEEDGQPITAKVGCAWYAGNAEGCRNSARFIGHPHDFNGTIGFRCATDPL